MLGDFYNIECIHTLREANQVADGFAKIGFSIPEGVLSFNVPPSWAHFLLLADKSAISFPRGY
uniref:RNase H type-1 domain-containing protein n=1 Tax=Cajanus cajan TaxID=3821 RepID=A0A151U3J3_CAJCA|nr:hypothetical protein KK1_006525 [Cajanus cajan]